MMFQSQNRETIKEHLKRFCVLQDHYDDERKKIVFHNTTPDLQDQDQDHSVQDQDQDRSVQDHTKTCFYVSDRSCPKTGGLRPLHWTVIGNHIYHILSNGTTFNP